MKVCDDFLHLNIDGLVSRHSKIGSESIRGCNSYEKADVQTLLVKLILPEQISGLMQFIGLLESFKKNIKSVMQFIRKKGF